MCSNHKAWSPARKNFASCNASSCLKEKKGRVFTLRILQFWTQMPGLHVNM